MSQSVDPSLPPAQLIHNMTGSLPQNDSSSEPLQLTLGTSAVDGGENWLIHEFDNSTLIDNAPYVGLRKVDSLTRYLLVCGGFCFFCCPFYLECFDAVGWAGGRASGL